MPESERPKAGKKSSKSRNSKEQGDEYDGELNKAGKREGRGICRFAGGDVSTGSGRLGRWAVVAPTEWQTETYEGL